MKKPVFANNHIYHVYNRGVEKRDIFLNNKDYFRFVHDLFEFNDETPAVNIYYKQPNLQSYEVQLRKIRKREQKPRKCFVDVLAFCLMSNHFHLLLQQKKERGVVSFMQKLGTGYTNYFNKKYERVGSLFQGRFKAVLVEQESHFIHLPYYIHANPLSTLKPSEKNNGKAAQKFLESYRWSSFPDYIGEKNFPSVTQREFLLQFFGGPAQHKKDFARWLTIDDTSELKDIALD